MIERYARVTCDKCGKEHQFDPRFEDPFSNSFVQEEQGLRGWGKVKGRHLCEDCHAAYDAYRAELERMIDEKFGL